MPHVFRVRRSCHAATLLLLFGLCSAVAGAVAAGARERGPFVDLIDYPRQEANWERFYGLQDHLAAAFFAACGGQACEPRRLLWPMQLRCSVRAAKAEVAACVWVVAGSDLKVRAVGSIDDDVVVWRCPMPIADGVGVEAFHNALQGEDPLHVRLPGARETLLQALRRCLAGPGSRS